MRLRWVLLELKAKMGTAVGNERPGRMMGTHPPVRASMDWLLHVETRLVALMLQRA